MSLVRNEALQIHHKLARPCRPRSTCAPHDAAASKTAQRNAARPPSHELLTMQLNTARLRLPGPQCCDVLGMLPELRLEVRDGLHVTPVLRNLRSASLLMLGLQSRRTQLPRSRAASCVARCCSCSVACAVMRSLLCSCRPRTVSPVPRGTELGPAGNDACEEGKPKPIEAVAQTSNNTCANAESCAERAPLKGAVHELCADGSAPIRSARLPQAPTDLREPTDLRRSRGQMRRKRALCL